METSYKLRIQSMAFAPTFEEVAIKVRFMKKIQLPTGILFNLFKQEKEVLITCLPVFMCLLFLFSI